MKKTLYLTALLFGLSACSESSPPVKIETFNERMFKVQYTKIKVTAISDEIAVEDIVVNRGNCKIINVGKKFPNTLKFGEYVSVTVPTSCSVSEIEVVTDDGDWSMSY